MTQPILSILIPTIVGMDNKIKNTNYELYYNI